MVRRNLVISRHSPLIDRQMNREYSSKSQLLACLLLAALLVAASNAKERARAIRQKASPQGTRRTFGDDVSFLREHTGVIVLSDKEGAALIALAPAWQGRVMSSSAAGNAGRSFGWINRTLIASGKRIPHINAFGGEDRLWLGPEGGQFSIFFAKGAPFDYAHWFVPEALDMRPFRTVYRSRTQARFQARFSLTNYAGTRLQVAVVRDVHLLPRENAWKELGLAALDNVALVAYESDNTLINAGKVPWRKETGLLSIWILGMFAPSSTSTILVPIKRGLDSDLGPKVTSDYFGAIPPNRLKVTDNAVFLRGDGRFRSKIGISPRRSLGILGSYDAEHRVLTIVKFSQPEGINDYVNSQWKLQDDPYGGDAVNSYNDGPPAPGMNPLGPFFEMESSSPAVALAPGESVQHAHRTFHLTGFESQLDSVARSLLGVSLTDLKAAFD